MERFKGSILLGHEATVALIGAAGAVRRIIVLFFRRRGEEKWYREKLHLADE